MDASSDDLIGKLRLTSHLLKVVPMTSPSRGSISGAGHTLGIFFFSFPHPCLFLPPPPPHQTI